jgi:hypothetical protein
MVRHLYTLFCQNILQDPEQNNSFIGVIDKVFADAMPCSIPSLYIYSCFSAKRGDSVSVSWIAPDGKELDRLTLALPKEDPSEAQGRKSWELDIDYIKFWLKPAVFEMEGLYEAIISVNNEEIHRAPLAVILSNDKK